MTNGFVRVVLVLIFVGLCGVAIGSELRIPPPDFESEYTLPDTQVEAARAEWWEYVDVAVLFAALCAGTYLAYRKRCRTGIFLLMVFSLVYFGFWREGCVCSIGAIGNAVWSVFDADYAMPVSAVIFFLLPMVFTLFVGRVFCGSVCPLGAIQDLVLLRPMKVPGWLEHGLRLCAYAYLGAAVLFAGTGSALLICRYDPFVGFFRLGASINMIVLGFCFLVVGVFVGRPYCRFLCPYGVILRLLGRLSRKRITITPDECIQCRLCEDSCPFGTIEVPTVDWPEEEYIVDKRRVGLLILLLPLLVIGLGWAGGRSSGVMSRMHPEVRLADRVYLENTGAVDIVGEVQEGVSVANASKSWRGTGESVEELIERAETIGGEFLIGGRVIGGLLGLIIGIKLIGVSIRFRRSDYEAHRGGCVACGRCFSYCPQEHVRLGKIGKAKGTSDG